MFAYCISAAYQEAASVARHGGPRCASRRAPKGAVEERIHRGAGSGASTDVLREIGAPCREIGAESEVYLEKWRDLSVRKTRYSAFIQGSSELDALLRGRGIDTVIV